LLVLAVGGISTVAGEIEGVLPEWEQMLKVPVWQPSWSVRGSGGYKDNVLLSGVLPRGSGFIGAGADLFLMRLPLDGPEASVLVSADNRHYLDVTEANEEATVLMNGVVKLRLGEGWRALVEGQYFFMNQVFDASVTELDTGSVLARGQSLGGRPGLSRWLGGGTWLDVEYPFQRQYFDAPLDDYWEGGARLGVRHGFGVKSEVRLAYESGWRNYDTREQVTADGEELAGTRLRYETQRAEANWRQHWDAGKHWRTQVRVGIENNRDNGSGYFDYRRCYVSGLVQFQSRGWEVRVQGSYGDYAYAVQTAADGSGSHRAKGLYGFGGRLGRDLGYRLKGFVEYEFEESVSNQALDAYRVNTVWVGAECEF
jgi:hypothetical protein